MNITCMVMAIFLRPKDEGAWIKIVHLQFFIFVIIREIAASVGSFCQGFKGSALFALLRVPIWYVAYALGLKVRKKASQLPPVKLSNFLCNTVLQGGVKAMAPMIFFNFEIVSCYTSTMFDDGKCNNTSRAALALSLYLCIIPITAIRSKALSREERGEGLTYERLTILRLKPREKIQGTFRLFKALALMYLFSVL